MEKKLNWGILSSGKISHDFVNALQDKSGPAAANNVVVAVAARDLERAREFAAKHDIPTHYGSYQQLADNPDIDIVYISTIVKHHYDTCKLMLEAGKHVLCEKTLTPNSQLSQELFHLAATKKLFFMEAVWANFFPTYTKIKTLICEGSIGSITHVEASFGKGKKEIGSGASFDLGIYLINLVRLVFDKEEPLEIIARGDIHSTGLDSGWDGILIFSGNRRAVLKCSTNNQFNNSARISGTKGYIEIPDPFHCPTTVVLPSGEKFTITLPDQAKYGYNYTNSAGLSFECAAVSDAVRAGKLECEQYTAADSLYIAGILDQIIKQINDTSS